MTMTFPDLADPNVTGPARAIAVAGAVQSTLRAARRAEPGRPDDSAASLAQARELLADLDAELSAWEQS